MLRAIDEALRLASIPVVMILMFALAIAPPWWASQRGLSRRVCWGIGVVSALFAVQLIHRIRILPL